MVHLVDLATDQRHPMQILITLTPQQVSFLRRWHTGTSPHIYTVTYLRDLVDLNRDIRQQLITAIELTDDLEHLTETTDTTEAGDD